MKRKRLPNHKSVRVYGYGRARMIRLLYSERCNVEELMAYFGVPHNVISQVLRWRDGRWPLAARCLIKESARP